MQNETIYTDKIIADANIQSNQPNKEVQVYWGKVIFIFLLTLSFSCLFWHSLNHFFDSFLTNIADFKNHFLRFVSFSCWLILFLSFFTIFILGIKEKTLIATSSFLLSLTILLAFPFLNLFSLAAIILFFLICLLYGFNLNKDYENYINFKPSQILPKTFNLFFLLLGILVSFYAFSKIQNTEQTLWLNPLIKQTSVLLTKYLFGINFNITEQTTIKEVSESLAKNIQMTQTTNLFNISLLEQLPVEELKKSSQALIAQQIAQALLKSFEQPNLDPEKTKFAPILENFLMQKSTSLLKSWLNYFSYLFSFTAFIYFRFSSFIWNFSTILLFKTLIYLLKSCGFVKLKHKERIVERLSFS